MTRIMFHYPAIITLIIQRDCKLINFQESLRHARQSPPQKLASNFMLLLNLSPAKAATHSRAKLRRFQPKVERMVSRTLCDKDCFMLHLINKVMSAWTVSGRSKIRPIRCLRDSFDLLFFVLFSLNGRGSRVFYVSARLPELIARASEGK